MSYSKFDFRGDYFSFPFILTIIDLYLCIYLGPWVFKHNALPLFISNGIYINRLHIQEEMAGTVDYGRIWQVRDSQRVQPECHQ